MSRYFQKGNTKGVFIGMVCNAKCGFCNAQIFRKEDRRFYSFEKVKKFILQKVKEGASCIIYEGGDFSFHPEIFKILDFGESLGLKQTFQTNGIKLADLEFVKKLKKYGLNDMNFSLHAYEEKVSDFIMGVDGAFIKTVKGIINSKKLGLSVCVNFVLIKENINQLEGMLLLLLRLGVDLFTIIMYIPVELLSDQFHKKYMINPKESGKEISKMLEIYKNINKISEGEVNITFKFHNVGRCVIDEEFHNVDFQYDLDRREANESDYTHGAGFYLKDTCKKCYYYNDCPGFTQKYIDFFGDDYIKPIIK